ncbi:aromatic ring-hydroxylating oxygenase subunit alpha [Piscinibacter sakaiensis]|uniref:aromatic ring-hydroxylating oxygenase subunit alpha n=1 Tax=Piscinibacter sakaiensis TaxID=1547922 RepID=UPI003AAAB9E1
MADARFAIDPDVAIAATLPSAFYLDPLVCQQVREKIFASAWHWLGRLDDVAAPGSLAPRELLPGLLNEPLLLARDLAGKLRCLSNVCTHRASLLVQQPCRADHIRCPYHSRRFELDGRLRTMPGFDGVRNFPSASDDLPELAFGEWAGHGFASLSPRWPLASWLDEMAQRLAWLPAKEWPADASRSRSFEFDAHWALYVENYLEGLHIPFVHPGLSGALDPAGYRYELGEAAVLQLALARDGEAAFEPPAGSPDHGLRVAAYYWWLFPNLMLNFYPWGLSVNVVEPIGIARTRVLFRSFVADRSLLGQGAGGALDPVEAEDEAVVCSVQRGIRSRLYRRGRYSARHERGVHHFHRLIAAALSA